MSWLDLYQLKLLRRLNLRLAAEAGIEGERTREQENGGARNLFAPLESNSDAV